MPNDFDVEEAVVDDDVAGDAAKLLDRKENHAGEHTFTM